MWKLAPIALLVLAGCSSGDASVGGGGHWTPPEPEPPELLLVGVVDSFGVDSEESDSPEMSLDPDLDGGAFTVYWDTEADDGYVATVRLSEGPSAHEGVLIGEFECDADEFCTDGVDLYCLYTDDFTMGCGLDPVEAFYNRADILSEMTGDIPVDAHIVVEVCDYYEDFCQSHPVPVVLY